MNVILLCAPHAPRLPYLIKVPMRRRSRKLIQTSKALPTRFSSGTKPRRDCRHYYHGCRPWRNSGPEERSNCRPERPESGSSMTRWSRPGRCSTCTSALPRTMRMSSASAVPSRPTPAIPAVLHGTCIRLQVGARHFLPIHVQGLVAMGDLITRQADDALDVVPPRQGARRAPRKPLAALVASFAGKPGIAENEHVAPLRLADLQELAVEHGQTQAVGELCSPE